MFRLGIFDKRVLMPKYDKRPDPSFFEINLDFLFPHTEQIDFNIILPFLVLETLEFLFPVCLLHLTQEVFMFIFYNYGCLKNNQQGINHQLCKV